MGVLTAWMVLAAAGLPAAGVDFDGPRIEVKLQSPGGILLEGETPQLAWGELTLTAQDRVQAPQLTYGDQGTLQARIRAGEDTYELKLAEAGFPPRPGQKQAAKAPARTEGGVAVGESEQEVDTVTLRGRAELKHNGKVVAPDARVWVTADRGRGPALRVVIDGLPKKQFPGGRLEARFDDVLIAKAGEAQQRPAETGTGGSGEAKAQQGKDGEKNDARAEAEQQGRDEGEGWIREARPGESGVLSVMEFEALEEDRRQERRAVARGEATREDEAATGTGGSGEAPQAADATAQRDASTGEGETTQDATAQGDRAGATDGAATQGARTGASAGTARDGASTTSGTGGSGPAATPAEPRRDAWVDPFGPAPVAQPVDALDGAVGGAGSPLTDNSDLTPVAPGRTVALPQGNGPGIGGAGIPQGSGTVNGRDAAANGEFPGLSTGPQGVSPGFANGLREVQPGFDAADGVGGDSAALFPSPGFGDAPALGSAQTRALNSTTRPLDPRLAPIDFSVTPGQSSVASGGTVDSDRPVGSVGVPNAAAMSPGSRSDLGIANGAQVAPGIPGSPAPLNNGRFPEALLNMSGIATGLPGTPAPLNDGRFPLGPQGVAPSATGVDAQSGTSTGTTTGNGANGTTNSVSTGGR